jgi:hypothetical protein
MTAVWFFFITVLEPEWFRPASKAAEAPAFFAALRLCVKIKVKTGG